MSYFKEMNVSDINLEQHTNGLKPNIGYRVMTLSLDVTIYFEHNFLIFFLCQHLAIAQLT
jgi:hypothetical protein